MSNSAKAKALINRGRRIVLRSRNVRNFSPRAWLAEAGFVPYEPGPWPTEAWDEAYAGGQLDYFGELSERGRFAVTTGYIDVALQQLANDSDRGSELAQVLDAGCGDGLLYERCRHLPFTRWIGVDLSSAAVAEAGERASSQDDTRAEFMVGDLIAGSGDWANEQFDIVVISEVINMCESPDDLLKQMAAVLRPGGWLVVSTWRHRGDRPLQKKIRSLLSLVDHTDVIPAYNDLAPRGWRVSFLGPQTV